MTTKEGKKYLDEFVARAKEGEFICPFNGPCNSWWEKAADSEFGDEFNKLVPSDGRWWSLRTSTLQDSKIPDNLREWTRIGFLLKYWEKVVKDNPKFLKFIVTRGCRPWQEVLNKGDSKYEFTVINLTFLSKYQNKLLKCFQ